MYIKMRMKQNTLDLMLSVGLKLFVVVLVVDNLLVCTK